MDYRTEMARHIAEFERWEGVVERTERQALARVQAGWVGRTRSTRSLSTPDDYYVDKDLEDNWAYKRAKSTRNGHQQAALMYGVAAMVASIMEWV